MFVLETSSEARWRQSSQICYFNLARRMAIMQKICADFRRSLTQTLCQEDNETDYQTVTISTNITLRSTTYSLSSVLTEQNS